jgi:hypothetical protein
VGPALYAARRADAMGGSAGPCGLEVQGGHRVIFWKTSHGAFEGDTTVTAPGSIDPARFLHGQHPPLPHNLIPARGQILAHSPVSDYRQHWRPSRRRWPAGFLPVDHLGRYAAPSIRSRIHNFVSYLLPASAVAPWRGRAGVWGVDGLVTLSRGWRPWLGTFSVAADLGEAEVGGQPGGRPGSGLTGWEGAARRAGDAVLRRCWRTPHAATRMMPIAASPRPARWAQRSRSPSTTLASSTVTPG